MAMIRSIAGAYTRAAPWLAAWLGPVVLLLMRVWVGLAFWRAGLVKIADPMGTQFLFNTTYQVPLLPPDVAAVLSTWIELVMPWFLGLGLLGRPASLFLFIYNIIAFTSFPGLWPHGFWTGLLSTSAFADHKIWGLMLLAVVAWGPGRLSLDALIALLTRAWRRRRDHTTPARAA